MTKSNLNREFLSETEYQRLFADDVQPWFRSILYDKPALAFLMLNLHTRLAQQCVKLDQDGHAQAANRHRDRFIEATGVEPNQYENVKAIAENLMNIQRTLQL